MTKRTTPKKTRAKKTPVKKTEEVSNVEPNTLDMIIALKKRATEEKEYQLAAVLREIEKAYRVNEREPLWVKKAINNVFHIVGMEDTWKWERLGEEKEFKLGEQSFTTQEYKVTLPETLWENKPDLKETVKKVINTDRKDVSVKLAEAMLSNPAFVTELNRSFISKIKRFFGMKNKINGINRYELAEVATTYTVELLKAIDKTKK